MTTAMFSGQPGKRQGLLLLPVIFGLLLFLVPEQSLAQDDKLAKYANKWLVVIGGDQTLTNAWRIKVDNEIESDILRSTYFSGLNPGWFLVVTEAHKSKARALAASKKLKRRKIDNYIKNSGPLFDFEKEKVRQHPQKTKADQSSRKSCFLHTKKQSPDGNLTVSFAFQDPTADGLVIQRGDDKKTLAGLFFKTEEIFWSADSKKIVFGDEDLYAGSGNQGFIIVNVETQSVAKIETTKFGTRLQRGQRDMFKVSDVCWLADSDVVMFRLSVNYMGGSGHRGIDEERQERLGKNFDKNDPVDLGTYLIYLPPGPLDLETRPADVPLYALNKYGYIDKSGKMIIKPKFDQAGSFIKGFANVKLGALEKAINKKGQLIGKPKTRVEPKAVAAVSEPSKIKPIKVGQHFGYQDDSGMIVIDPLYDRAGPFENGLALVAIGGQSGYINVKGETLGGVLWEEVHPFIEDLARVKRDGKYGYIDKSGKLVIEPQFSQAADFSQGLAAVKIGQ
ncbi:MAG: WG repeat-containing protein [Deltaproteobacteria bacterium]|nr:WG repeat-containing protein [Deltaproteobacteria bacterium]MBW1873256.1 WG repeat-containing protein [Deltaproteobacteria bacterium]